jgi:hypothetical protein
MQKNDWLPFATFKVVQTHTVYFDEPTLRRMTLFRAPSRAVHEDGGGGQCRRGSGCAGKYRGGLVFKGTTDH